MLNEIDLSRADLNLLVLFEAVLGGMSAARPEAEPFALRSQSQAWPTATTLNDPLFLRTPKGVVPTERASELAEPIAEILARVRRVISTAEPFDPAMSTRRFTIGAPDGASAVFLFPLLTGLRRSAPGIDISVRQILPPPGIRTTERAWEPALADLEARAIDLVVAPVEEIPARFVARTLYEEEFVIAMRAGHPFADDPTLDGFCRMQHLVVSLTGDAYGFVDDVLAKEGRSRRVALTVPNFMFALAVVAETDLIAALPKRFVAMHALRFDVASLEAPLPLHRFRIRAIAPKAALMDAGVAWLFDLLGGPERTQNPRSERPLF